MHGRDSYEERLAKYVNNGKKHIFPRNILEGDLVVVKKLSAERQEEYLAATEAREMPVVNHWRDILRGYHLDNNAPPPLLQQVIYIHIYTFLLLLLCADTTLY